MIKEDCLFCKIANGKVRASKFYEDESFVVALDLFPNTKGASLVISKQHVTSDVFKADFNVMHKALDVAKIAANMLSKALKPSRVSLVTEGIFIDHLHLKLYPLYGVEKLHGNAVSDGVFFEKFPGYITTQSGPMWDVGDLEELALKISGASETN